MVQKIIYNLLGRRHYWRTVSFDELSEIYASQFLRSLAVSLIGIFVPIYLYGIGYSLQDIAVLFFLWFLFRIPLAYINAKVIGIFGPKHGIALSVVLHIVYLTFVLSADNLYWPIWIIALAGSAANGLYLMAFNVDFSKIKHTEHGGKELGYLQIFERIGAVIGPLAGGLIAGFFDPKYTIILSIVVLFGSLIPIFLSAEPVKINQQISLRGFPFKRHKRDFLVGMAFQLENVISVVIWPLFLGIFVLVNRTYESLGILASVSTASAIIAVYIIGKLIDDDKGRKILNIGAIGNAVLHIFRIFVTMPLQALGINILNEPLTAMYRMSFLKGMFDASDSVPGYRIVYYMVFEWFIAAINIIFWLGLYLILFIFSDKMSLQITFVVAAVCSLIITKQKFNALR
jgi:MFS family permease